MVKVFQNNLVLTQRPLKNLSMKMVGRDIGKKYSKPFSNKGIATGCFKCDGVNKGNIGWPNVDRNTKDGKIALDCLSTACGKQIKHIPKGWCTDPDWKCDCESLN